MRQYFAKSTRSWIPSVILRNKSSRNTLVQKPVRLAVRLWKTLIIMQDTKYL